MNKLGLRKRDWCPQPPDRLPTKLKRYSIPIAAVFTATIILSVSFFSFSIMSDHPAVPIAPLVTATSSMQNFATDIAAADGKVFTIDNWGIVDCFNTQTGKEVWSTNAGGYTAMPQSITSYNGAVYAATAGGVVVSLDENTGKVLSQFQAPVSSSFGQKTPPRSFSVAGGFVFVSSDGLATYNASTGRLLWEVQSPSLAIPPFSIPQTGAVWPLEDKVFLAAGESYLGYSVDNFYRINPENGSALWYAPGYSSSPALYYQGQVILWNDGSTSQGGQTVVSVDASSGSTLWTFDVGSSIYQPVASNGLLLFGASDGNFYALRLANGTLAWKTPFDPQNYMATYNSVQPIISPVQVDSQNQEIFWGFMVVKSGPAQPYGSEQYVGAICSLNMTNGQIVWTNQISYNGYISNTLTSSSVATLGLAVCNNTLYLTASSDPNYMTSGGDLWQISESTGTVLGTQYFYHYVLPPVEADNKVFVAADLYLLSYPNVNMTSESPNNPLTNASLFAFGAVVAVVVVVLVVFLLFRKRLRNKPTSLKGEIET